MGFLYRIRLAPQRFVTFELTKEGDVTRHCHKHSRQAWAGDRYDIDTAYIELTEVAFSN